MGGRLILLEAQHGEAKVFEIAGFRKSVRPRKGKSISGVQLCSAFHVSTCSSLRGQTTMRLQCRCVQGL